MSRIQNTDEVRFFQDDPTPTKIRWYFVPSDRPVLPVASFVARPEWTSEEGVFSGQMTGNPPTEQGPQWVAHHFLRKGNQAYPWEKFTGKFCGTPEQWAGQLRTDRPLTDIGHPGCCAGDIVILPCACVQTTVVVIDRRLHALIACACVQTAADVGTSGHYGLSACACVQTTTIVRSFGHYALTSCACVQTYADVRSLGHYALTACACLTTTAASVPASHYALTACACLASRSQLSTAFFLTSCACLKTTAGTLGMVVKGRAHLNSAQTTIVAGGWQKVLIDTVDFDTGGIWDAAGKQWKPTQAGYYLCSARVRFNGQFNPFATAIGQNGSQVLGIGGDSGTNASQAHGASALINCNGTTDTIQLFVFASVAAGITTGSFDTWLEILGPF